MDNYMQVILVITSNYKLSNPKPNPNPNPKHIVSTCS